MKRILLTLVSFALVGSVYATCETDACLWVCDVSDDANGNVEFTVCATSTQDIAGFQFGLEVENSDFQLNSISAGSDASNFVIKGESFVLGYAFGTSPISAGEELKIAKFKGSYTYHDNSSIVTTVDVVLASPDAEDIKCTAKDNTWDGTLLSGAMPAEYSLGEAYPNPFNPTTTIEYNIEVAGNVSIMVYDLMGREIKELVNDFKTPSNSYYSVIWDGTNNAGSLVSSGMYIYRMISNNFTQTHRLTLMK
jgi:hypothetical protein